MAKVVKLERQRVEALAHELAPVLRDHGYVLADLGDVEDVDRWRRAARRAGRLLGWRVRTRLSRDGRRVWAASDDWPTPPGAHQDAARRLDALLLRRPGG